MYLATFLGIGFITGHGCFGYQEIVQDMGTDGRIAVLNAWLCVLS